MSKHTSRPLENYLSGGLFYVLILQELTKPKVK